MKICKESKGKRAHFLLLGCFKLGNGYLLDLVGRAVAEKSHSVVAVSTARRYLLGRGDKRAVDIVVVDAAVACDSERNALAALDILKALGRLGYLF